MDEKIISAKNNIESIKDAADTAAVVEKAIDEGNISDIPKQIIELTDSEKGDSQKIQYVFKEKIEKIDIAIGVVCLTMACCAGYGCFIGLSATVFSKTYFLFGIVCLVVAAMILVLNIHVIVKQIKQVRYIRRYNKYIEALRYGNLEIIEDLSSYAGVGEGRIILDLQTAVKRKKIPQGHFGTNNIIFFNTDKAYEKYMERQADYDRYYKKYLEDRIRAKSRPEEIENIIKTGNEYIEKIRKSNDVIKDKVMSEKLDRMEKVVSVIFHEVDLNPEQSDKLGLFLNYYLPTTEKLLESYMDIDEKKIERESLTKAKLDIENAIDTINDSFEGILDRFYKEQELDIASDISSMKVLMKQEGV